MNKWRTIFLADINCPVCGLKVGRIGWPNHVYAHKLEFCRRTGKPESYVRLVVWSDVLNFFGPKNDGTSEPIGGQAKLGDWR